jgi:hypothetical protein
MLVFLEIFCRCFGGFGNTLDKNISAIPLRLIFGASIGPETVLKLL